MEEYVGKVCALVTFSGDMIGRIEKIENNIITLYRPRLFVTTDNGPILATGVCATGEEYPEQSYFSINNILTFVEANSKIKNVWRQMDSDKNEVVKPFRPSVVE
jgi:hypothetical protein